MSNGQLSPEPYRILFSKNANKYYQRIILSQAKRIDQVLLKLSHDPYRGGDIKRLTGMPGLFRLRVGDLRVIFEIREKEKSVWVDQILPRGQAYK